MKIKTIHELIKVLSNEDYKTLLNQLLNADTDVMDLVDWIIETEKKYDCNIDSYIFEKSSPEHYSDLVKKIRDKKLNDLGI